MQQDIKDGAVFGPESSEAIDMMHLGVHFIDCMHDTDVSLVQLGAGLDATVNHLSFYRFRPHADTRMCNRILRTARCSGRKAQRPSI